MEMPERKPTMSMEQELNPWEAQEARFDFAAKKLGLEDGIWKVLRQPARELIVHGKLKGNAQARDRIEVSRTGSVLGDLAMARISIEDGAFIQGRVDIRVANTPAVPTVVGVAASAGAAPAPATALPPQQSSVLDQK